VTYLFINQGLQSWLINQGLQSWLTYKKNYDEGNNTSPVALHGRHTSCLD